MPIWAWPRSCRWRWPTKSSPAARWVWCEKQTPTACIGSALVACKRGRPVAASFGPVHFPGAMPLVQPHTATQDRETRERHALAMARIVDPNRWPKGKLLLLLWGVGAFYTLGNQACPASSLFAVARSLCKLLQAANMQGIACHARHRPPHGMRHNPPPLSAAAELARAGTATRPPLS